MYVHRVYNLNGQLFETVINPAKVVAFTRSQGTITLYFDDRGQKPALTIYEMPDVANPANAAEYQQGIERAYAKLYAALNPTG